MKPDSKEPPTIALILQAEPGPVDGWVRLRQALKTLLRRFGLRNRFSFVLVIWERIKRRGAK